MMPKAKLTTSPNKAARVASRYKDSTVLGAFASFKEASFDKPHAKARRRISDR